MRFIITLLVLLSPTVAWAGAHEQNLPTAADYAVTASPEQQALIKEIEAFLVTYAENYNKQDYEALLAMWDQNDQNPVYMAEERDEPLYGWEEIRKYFDPVPGIQMLDGIRNTYTNVRAHYIGPDLAYATYHLQFDIKVRRQTAMSSWDRVVAVFRKVEGEWRLTTYAEAPMAPLTMVRKLLQDSTPDDFDEYIEAQQE
jgi:ketosteroid isomerase-like protein